MGTFLRFAIGAVLYFGFAFISPIALVAAPLGLLLAFQSPSRREAMFASICLTFAAGSVALGGAGFARFEAAWVCLLAGGAVIAIAWRPPARGGLVATGLVAVAIAAAAGILLVGVTAFSFDELRWLAARHYGMQSRLVLSAMSRAVANADGGAELVQRLEAGFNEVVDFVARFLPALVLIQSVAALAAAWALYRTVATHPEGESLPRLRDFRFSDHLIWGIVFALVALVIPGASSLRLLGGNVATFFGALYVLRGIGVVAALGAAAGFGGALSTLAALLATVFLLPLVMFGALALGVSDTWVDWRKLAKRAQGR